MATTIVDGPETTRYSSTQNTTRGWCVYAEYEVTTNSATQWQARVRLGIRQMTGGAMSFEASRLYWSISGGGISTGTLGGTKTSLSDNQRLALTGWYNTTLYTKTTSAQSISITFSLWANAPASWQGSSSKAVSFSIPALASYAIAYNGNGATSGSVGGQTKYYGQAISLKANGFARTGYTFGGWKWNNAGTAYAAGTSWNGANSAGTFYAQWTANTYTVAYDGNGATSGSTDSSSHTYDVAKTLTTNGFTKTDCLFLGWATTSGGAVQYEDGVSVINLATSGTKTLYAVWKDQYVQPDIQNPVAVRTNSEGVAIDTGTAAVVSAYVVPGTYEETLGNTTDIRTTVAAYYRETGSSSYTQIGSAQIISTAQTVSWLTAENIFSEDKQYDILFTAQVVVSNVVKAEASPNTTFISTASFLIDMSPDDNSIGIFAAAPADDNVVLIGVGGDIVFELDNDALIGTDSELIEALTTLGWA